MATFYLAIYPAGAATPTWSRANVGTNSGWSGSPVYHDADTDPGTGSTYQFSPDASGLIAGTPYDAYAVWDDGATTSGIVSQLGWSTAAATSSVSADLSGAYGVRAAASGELPGAFTVRMSVSADLAGSYEVQSANTVSRDLAGAYAIRSQVYFDRAGAFTIRTNTFTDLGGAFSVWGNAAQDLPGTFVVRGLVSRDLPGTYDVYNGFSVSADRSGVYFVRGAATRDLAGSYLIQGDFGDYPDPSTVLLGTTYGPGGIYAGTLLPGGDADAIAAAVWAAAPALTVGKFIALK